METSGMNEEDVLNMLFKITENDEFVQNDVDSGSLITETYNNSPAAATSMVPSTILYQNYVTDGCTSTTCDPVNESSDLPDLLTEFNQIQALGTLAHQQCFQSTAPPSDHVSVSSHVSATPEASSQSVSSPSSQYLSDSDQISKGSPESSHGKAEESSKSQSDDQCLICGKFSGKHNYYGGQGCLSCRAFFRRTVQSKSHMNFNCSEEGKCNINSQSWRSCQACRFQKCLKAGMRPSYVLNESERKDSGSRER
jgi:hypothetical protein